MLRDVDDCSCARRLISTGAELRLCCAAEAQSEAEAPSSVQTWDHKLTIHLLSFLETRERHPPGPWIAHRSYRTAAAEQPWRNSYISELHWMMELDMRLDGLVGVSMSELCLLRCPDTPMCYCGEVQLLAEARSVFHSRRAVSPCRILNVVADQSESHVPLGLPGTL